jgi:hypothetical protein
MSNARAYFESLRSLGFVGISAAYAAVGTPTDHQIKAFCVTNRTQGDIICSFDNTDADGQFIVIAGSYKLYDVQSNMNAQFDDKFVFPKGSQLYVKQVAAPVSGSVYFEVIH